MLARGVCRLFVDMGYSPMTEVSLASGRRVDVMGVDGKGRVAVAEIKSSIADYRADQKWQDYLEFCDLFFFAVADDFPQEILPGEVGLIVADRYGGVVARPAPIWTLHASRRKALTLRFARKAAERLWRVQDQLG